MIHLQGFPSVTSPMAFGIFYCNLVGIEVAAGGVHWKGKDKRVGVGAGVVLSLTKVFPEAADSGWRKNSLSRGGAPSSHSKGIVCLEGGKRCSEQGGRWDVAEMDGQGTPGLPCKCFSISTGMALREACEGP